MRKRLKLKPTSRMKINLINIINQSKSNKILKILIKWRTWTFGKKWKWEIKKRKINLHSTKLNEYYYKYVYQKKSSIVNKSLY